MADMTDEELVGYAHIHSRTERALFHVEHVNRLLRLAGENVSSLERCEWIAVYPETIDLLLEKIRAKAGCGLVKPNVIQRSQYETFGCPDEQVSRLVNPEASVWNGKVRVRRYRITVELIDEPEEEVQTRVQKLYNKTSNIHEMAALHLWASKNGFSLSRDKP